MTTISNNVFYGMNLTDGQACVALSGGWIYVLGNTFVNLHQPPPSSPFAASALKASSVGGLWVENNVFAYTSEAKALSFLNTPGITLRCNVFWENVGGVGYPLDPTDRIVDPQFCDLDARDYTLQPTSACLPPYSLGCDLIGALGQGCGSVGVEPGSWAKVKAAYRGPSANGHQHGEE